MVVKVLNTIVAHRTVGGAGRSVKVTRVTVLEPHAHVTDYHCLEQRRMEIILIIFSFFSLKDTRVGECCLEEIEEGKEKDYLLYNKDWDEVELLTLPKCSRREDIKDYSCRNEYYACCYEGKLFAHWSLAILNLFDAWELLYHIT